MRDGEHKECPIIPNEGVRLNYGEGEDDYLFVAASHDTIQIFPNSNYNHLRYWDNTDGMLKAVWLAHNILADLVDAGIPTAKRNSITESEYEAYQEWSGRMATAAVAMLDETAGDDLDAIVADATSHLDAEIDYYLDEWRDNGAA